MHWTINLAFLPVDQRTYAGCRLRSPHAAGPQDFTFASLSWWLNQPIWKIEHIFFWNHHLDRKIPSTELALWASVMGRTSWRILRIKFIQDQEFRMSKTDCHYTLKYCTLLHGITWHVNMTVSYSKSNYRNTNRKLTAAFCLSICGTLHTLLWFCRLYYGGANGASGMPMIPFIFSFPIFCLQFECS